MSVKKMVLVEPRFLEAIKNQSQKPFQKVMSDLDEEMNAILNQNDLASSEKMKLYNQVLQRYMTYKEKSTSTPVVIETKQPLSEIDILKDIPKQHIKKARNLLQFIKDNSFTDWNSVGEFVYNDVAVPKTNIKDLIRATISKNKHPSTIGFKEFKTAIDSFAPAVKWETLK